MENPYVISSMSFLSISISFDKFDI
jgi:hypothetical protein